MLDPDAEPEAPGQDSLLSVLTCLSLDESREQNKIVDMEEYWSQLNI